MQAGIAYLRKELKDHYPSTEIEGIIRLLFAGWKHYTTTDLLKKKDEKLSDHDRHYLTSVVERLKKHEPIQYILGETEFFGLPFYVTPDVLIPRPETEELVDWILKSIIRPDPVIADIGTGSGCIAVSLKKNLPGATVTGYDISERALQVARKNAERNSTDVKFLQLDLLKRRDHGLFQGIDLIVSNPPYITEKEKNQMGDNVVHFEPHSALFVPDHDPLKFYRALITFGHQYLNKGGRQFWEINESFGKECISLMKKNGFTDIELRRDINGKERMISGDQ